MWSSVLDSELRRHEVVICDKCKRSWTPEVAKMKGWMLNDPRRGDLCERCRPPIDTTRRRAR